MPDSPVLYGATTPEGAFAETVAGFRPSATLIAAFTAAGATPLPTLGVVPADWRLSRRLRRFSTEGALPFVDIEAPATHTYLIQQASGLLAARGPSTLDVSQVRGPSRTLTRGLSSWFYSRTDEHGQPLYAGIRYVSRLGDHECWAVFDGTDVALHSSEPITAGHHALHAVATVYGLTIE